MGRRKKEDAVKTRSKILASALTLFSKKGYEHVTFTDIAVRLKMTKGAVYWYFPSKEQLLIELVRMALESFRQQIEQLMPEGELTFPAIADMMIRNADKVVTDARSSAFFRLMKCQIRWTDASMASVREDLLSNITFGPKHAFIRAIDNDIAAGRVRPEVNSNEIATLAIALWDGLVQSKIDGFLTCDLHSAMVDAYKSIWQYINVNFENRSETLNKQQGNK